MQKSSINFSSTHQSRFKKLFKRKIFLSNELKKSLLISFTEAKNYGIYVNLDLFLYGLLSQSNALSSRLLLMTLSQFQNNTKVTTNVICNRLYERINLNIQKKTYNVTEFSLNLSEENHQTPWLTTEVRDLLKQAVINSIKTKDKITVVTTKDIFLELLNKEYIRDSLRQIIN